MKNSFFFIGLVLLLGSCSEKRYISKAAKNQDILLYGSVHDYSSGDPINNGKFILMRDGAEHFIGEIKNGKYAHFLDLDHTYRLEYLSDGHISKYVIIDTQNVPLDDRSAGFTMTIDITLIRPLEGVDYSFFENNPVGKASYDHTVGNMFWDTKYNSKNDKTIAAIMKAHDEAAK